MPYRRKYYKKRYRNRKKYPLYRRRKRYNPRNKLRLNRIRGVSTMPDMLITKLKYVGNISEIASASYSYKFAINGLYDPDLSGVGQQPMGFDQFMAFYERYEVRSSKITCMVSQNGAVEFSLIIYPSNDSTSLDAGDAQEQPYATKRVVSNNTSQSTVYLKNYITVKKLEGRNLNSVNFTGTNSANPSNVRYWHIIARSLDNISNMDWYGRVELIYYCRFYKRKSLTGS